MVKTHHVLAALAAAATLTTAMIGNDQAIFVLDAGPYLTFSRMDPIVSPGGVAGHVHMIAGASNFRNVLNTPEEQQRAKCTTVSITADKSNYWVPAMYWMEKNNTYSIMKPYNRIYYMGNTAAGKMQPFPPGLRMLSGLSGERKEGANQVLGVYSNMERGTTNRQFIMNGTQHPNAPDYIMSNVNFPSCGWANQSLDSPDHFSHMAWPIYAGGGQVTMDPYQAICPDTHPIKYPHLFIESIFYLSDTQKANWNKEGPNVILSNGDTTGTNWHGDFVNGWPTDVLAEAIDNCRVGDHIQDCPAISKFIQSDVARDKCRLEGMIPNEDVGLTGAIAELPGCNKRWDWTGSRPTCDSTPTPGYVAPQYQFNSYWFSLPMVLPKIAPSTKPSDIPANLDVDYLDYQPRVGPWATYYDWSTPVDIPDVTHASQDTDYASGAGIDLAAVPGQQDSSDYRNENPATTVDAAAVAAVGPYPTHYTASWLCKNDPTWYGMPCVEPTAGASDNAAPAPTAVATPTAVASGSADGSTTDSGSSTIGAPADFNGSAATDGSSAPVSGNLAALPTPTADLVATAPAENNAAVTGTASPEDASSIEAGVGGGGGTDGVTVATVAMPVVTTAATGAVVGTGAAAAAYPAVTGKKKCKRSRRRRSRPAHRLSL